MILAMWTGHTDRSRALALCVRDTIDSLGWKYEQVAQWMGLASVAQLSRQLAGAEPLNLWRLAELPDDFHREFDSRKAGLRSAVVLEAPKIQFVLGAATLGKKAMARMVEPVTVQRQSVTLPLQKEKAS